MTYPPQRSSTLLIGFCLAALVGAGISLILTEQRRNAQLAELAQTREALRLADETLAVQRETNRKLEARLTETLVTNVPPPVTVAAVTPASSPTVVENAGPVRWTAAEAAGHQSQVIAPSPKFVTSGKVEQKIITFSELPAADGKILMTRAEYRGALGQKLMFRSGTAAARSFDYAELHPGVLAHLSLDPYDLRAQQAALDDRKAQSEQHAQKAREAKAAADLKYQEAMRAARLVQNRIATEQKKVEQEESLRLQALETERIKAEAALIQAEAAMEKARNPQPVILLDTRHQGLAPLVNPALK